jgi:Ca2+-transporting ATPase
LYTPEVATTMAFATLGLIQLTHSLNVRSNTKSLFKLGVFTNMYLIGAIAVSALLQLVVIVVSFLDGIFRVKMLTLEQWSIVLAASLAIVPVVEMAKIIHNARVKQM